MLLFIKLMNAIFTLMMIDSWAIDWTPLKNIISNPATVSLSGSRAHHRHLLTTIIIYALHICMHKIAFCT